MADLLSAGGLTEAGLLGALREAFGRKGKPHRLESDLIEFPVDLILTKASQDVLPNTLTKGADVRQAVCKILGRRHILIVGTCSEDTPISIPEEILRKTVVLMLRQNGHYGFRAPLYSEDDVSTWEGPTDDRPVRYCWELCQLLRTLHTKQEVYMLGVSAGVDSILSLVACQPSEYHDVFTIKTFVAIAGAYHPSLYTQVHKRFRSNNTCVIVHHHERDQYSDWNRVCPSWVQMTGDIPLYWNVLTHDTCPQLCEPFHHVAHILISQKAFWTRLFCSEGHNFVAKCKEVKLGHIEETYAVEPTNGWHDLNDRAAHFLLFAFCACSAAVDASACCTDVLDWLSIFIANLQRMNSRQCESELKELLHELPDYTFANLTHSHIIPCLLAEASLKVIGSMARSTGSSVIFISGNF